MLICVSFWFLTVIFFPSVHSLLAPQDETVSSDKSSSRDPAALAHSGFSLAASAYAQDQLYTNGGLNYSFRGYGTLGNNLQNNGTPQTNGEWKFM